MASEGRMANLRRFIRSAEFFECLVKARISSAPRWSYIRELELDAEEKTEDAVGGNSADSDGECEFSSV